MRVISSRDSLVSFRCSLRTCFNRFFILQFRRMCIDAYRRIRIHAPFWYALLTRVADADRARRHVLQRLVPGQKQEEAEDILVEIVDRSSSGSWGQAITDTSHAWSTWARSWLPSTPMMFKMDD